MVPQYCSYGSIGVPAVLATIFLSAERKGRKEKKQIIQKCYAYSKTCISWGFALKFKQEQIIYTHAHPT